MTAGSAKVYVEADRPALCEAFERKLQAFGKRDRKCAGRAGDHDQSSFVLPGYRCSY